ncbi:MAG: hypothetical protein DRJ35_01660, partial [Thermoprotei archaeon]
PGLIDLHNHSVQILFRGDFDGLPLMAWLRETDKLYEILDSQDVFNAARLSFYEKVLCGVTSVLDMEREVDMVANAAREVGIRLFEAYAMFDQVETRKSGLERINDIDKELRSAEKYVRGYMSDPMVDVLLGPVGFPSSSFELMEGSARLARRLGVGIHSHLAENPVNDKLARTLGFAGEFEELEKRGFFGEDVILAHTVYVDDMIIDSMAKYGVSVAHCPSSNAKLGNGVAHINKMIKRGVNVGLGTDGAASNDSESILGEMKIASLLQRGLHRDSTIMDSQVVLDMATVNAGRALGRMDIGSIEVGKKADIVLLDLRHPSMQPSSNLLDNIVFSADCRVVDTVIVSGKIVVRGGKLTVEEERWKKVLKEYQESRKKIESVLMHERQP